jgi:hypothetical protein
MGFMDKAKQLAEQAQQKLDEAQKNFNQSNSPESQPQGDAVKYDEHGRPIQEPTPAGATAPPTAEPAAPAADAPSEPAPGEAPPAPKPASDANESPDPFKPIQ